jgi:hypothetical protein
MKSKFAYFVFVFAFCAPAIASAQDRPTPTKVYDLPADSSDKVFYETAAQFLKKLKLSHSTTTGFIAIKNNAVERESYLKELIKKSPSLTNRIDFSHPGTAYNTSWSSNEFWIIPKGAEPPYRPTTSDVSCPTIDISGPWIGKPGSVLTFTAEIMGRPQSPVSYKWTIEGGRILRKNEFSIDARVNAKVSTLVTKLTILGLPDDIDTCPTTAVHETRIVPK